METVVFNIPSISCSACSEKITEGIKDMNGINNVSVDLKSQTVKVDYNPSEIKSKEISRKITSLGYEVYQ